MLQPALDEDNFINVAIKARTLLDAHGQQRLEQKGRQRVRDKNMSPTAPSKRRQRSLSSTSSTTCHAIAPPKAYSLLPQCSVPELASRAHPITVIFFPFLITNAQSTKALDAMQNLSRGGIRIG